MIFVLLLWSFSVLFLLWARKMRSRIGHLESLGIPVEPPRFFGLLGSGRFDLHNATPHLDYLEKFLRYKTKAYGTYQGDRQTIVTVDLDIIRSVMVKNFDCFDESFELPQLPDRQRTLDATGGEVWRSLRRALSPTFTSARLKAMLEPMAGVTHAMMRNLDRMVGGGSNVVDLKPIFQGLSLDIISKCAFGIDTDALNNPDQEIVKHGRGVFEGFRASSVGMAVIFAVFEHFPWAINYISIIPPAYDALFKISRSIMDERKQRGINSMDFVGRLMELREERQTDPSLCHLSDDIIVAQGIVFIFAGFETTSNTICTLCYNLARSQEAQDAVYAELKDMLERHEGRIDHETIAELNLMEAAIKEDLRLMGPITKQERMCKKDCEVAPGMLIKKGTRVMMPIYACHHYPEYFPDPEKFIPERFLKEGGASVPPMAFRAFGDGPRVCIGMRFAMTEMKIAMATLLAKYRIELEHTNQQIDVLKGDLILFGYDDMRLRLVRRD